MAKKRRKKRAKSAVGSVAKRSSAMAKRSARPKRAKKAHEVYAKGVGARLSKAERDIKSLAKGQSTIARTVGAHHEILRVHHERIGRMANGLRSLLPPNERKQIEG
ncbi:MAG: hypothetical protein U0269_30385 [Polyangiales bacterium]|jgi:hypothetical protein